MVRSGPDYVWGAPGAARRGDVRAQAGLAFLVAVFKRCKEEGRFSWKDVVEPTGRDLRFSNGVVIGSRRFVETHVHDAADRQRRWRPNHIVGDIYSSHGQRSAPMATRVA
jgi:acyl dehydratase